MRKHTHNAITALATAGSLYATALQAEAIGVIGRMANQNGGEMIITDVKCVNHDNGVIIVSSASGGGNSIHGCLTMMGSDRFYVSWDNGSTSVLPANGWVR